MKARRRTVAAFAVSVAVAALVVVATPAAHSSAAELSTSPVKWLATGADIPGTWSQLVRTDDGVGVNVHTNSLAPGTVVSAWWVFFNNPDACTAGLPPYRCGAGDFSNPAVLASVQQAGAHVIGESGYGNYGAYFSAGADPECAGPAIPCAGLLDPRGADVHIALRTHGATLPGALSEQLSSFNGGCPPNVCQTIQFTAHQAD